MWFLACVVGAALRLPDQVHELSNHMETLKDIERQNPFFQVGIKAMALRHSILAHEDEAPTNIMIVDQTKPDTLEKMTELETLEGLEQIGAGNPKAECAVKAEAAEKAAKDTPPEYSTAEKQEGMLESMPKDERIAYDTKMIEEMQLEANGLKSKVAAMENTVRAVSQRLKRQREEEAAALKEQLKKKEKEEKEKQEKEEKDSEE